MLVDGGLISKTTKFPKRGKQGELFAVQGIWTGGAWSPVAEVCLQQYRNHQRLGKWKLVGVDLLNQSITDVVLILQLSEGVGRLQPDDVLVFGEGECSIFEVEDSDLPVTMTTAVEVGGQRYKGIVKVNEFEQVTQLIIFHPPGELLDVSRKQTVWYDQNEYTVFLALPIHLNGAEASESLQAVEATR